MITKNPHAKKTMNQGSMTPKVNTGGPDCVSAPQTGRASGKHHRAMGGGPKVPRQRKKGFSMPKPDKYGYY